jgi:hypothetical protein
VRDNPYADDMRGTPVDELAGLIARAARLI